MFIVYLSTADAGRGSVGATYYWYWYCYRRALRTRPRSRRRSDSGTYGLLSVGYDQGCYLLARARARSENSKLDARNQERGGVEAEAEAETTPRKCHEANRIESNQIKSRGYSWLFLAISVCLSLEAPPIRGGALKLRL